MTLINIHQGLVDQILDLPSAYLLIQEVNAALEEEKKRRIAFYNDITEQIKAEFINGEIVVHSPVIKYHNEITLNVAQLLNAHSFKKGGVVGVEKLLIKLTRNDYEPDVCYFSAKKSKKFTDEQKFFPAPDLIVEVLSKSTAKRDRTTKFQDYEAHGVQEYWLIEPKTKTIEQYILKNKKYELELKSKEGTLRSAALIGFEIPIEAIFDKIANFKAMNTLLT